MNPGRAVVGTAIAIVVSALLAPAAGAAPAPEVRKLQRQVKALQTQVTSLRSELNALKAVVGEVSTKADAANTAAASAGENANAAVTKTNCIVTATAFAVWNNFVFFDAGNLFTGTGMDIAAPSDTPSGYLAGVNPSCVPSVLPRFPSASFAAHESDRSVGAFGVLSGTSSR
jgi:hypothetical protein